MAILDAAQFFSRTLIPTINGRGPQRRVPFTFSSTQRLLANGALGAANSRQLAKADAKATLAEELKVIEGIESTSSVVGTLGLSTFTSALSTLPVISMMINPNSVKWHQPKRFTKRDTMNGSTFFHFTDDNGCNNDILDLQFSGSTGNINTQNLLDSTATAADVKLRIWHQLYALSRERVLLDNGVRNQFFITYRTILMPIPITFVGFFNSALEFTEDAAHPYSRNYSFGFTVTDTSPKLEVLVEKINSALVDVGGISAVRSVI